MILFVLQKQIKFGYKWGSFKILKQTQRPVNKQKQQQQQQQQQQQTTIE
jgi:hypothetical protein